MDCCLPGSSVHGILQEIILEQVAISSSRGSSRPRDGSHISWIFYMAGGFFTLEPPGRFDRREFKKKTKNNLQMETNNSERETLHGNQLGVHGWARNSGCAMPLSPHTKSKVNLKWKEIPCDHWNSDWSIWLNPKINQRKATANYNHCSCKDWLRERKSSCQWIKHWSATKALGHLSLH